jgi:hypothetical protein
MLAIILLASLPPSPSAEAIQTLDLGKLSWLDAQALHGKPVRVRFTVFARCGRHFVAAGEPGVSRCVRFSQGVYLRPTRAGERCVVDGVLQVRYHPARTSDGVRFEAVLAVTVEEATPVRLGR